MKPTYLFGVSWYSAYLSAIPQLRCIPIHGFAANCIPLSFPFIPELHPSFLYHQIPFLLVSFHFSALFISFRLSHFPRVVAISSLFLFLFMVSSISISISVSFSTYSAISILPSYHVIFLYNSI